MNRSELIEFIQKKNLLDKSFTIRRKDLFYSKDLSLEEDSFVITDNEVIII